MRIRMLPSRPAAVEQPLYEPDGSTLLFSPPGVGAFRCSADEIAISPTIGADADEIIALLVATALPASVWIAGGFVLHSAAVRLPGQDRMIAFAARSGGGKSALAAKLVEIGASLVADDTISIVERDGAAVASGLPGGWFARMSNERKRIFRSVPAGSSLRRCTLGAIVVLSDEPPTDSPVRLDPLSAVEQLLANVHRPRIPALLGKRLDMLRFCVFLARTVPLYTWSREQSAGALDHRALEALGRCIADEER